MWITTVRHLIMPILFQYAHWLVTSTSKSEDLLLRKLEIVSWCPDGANLRGHSYPRNPTGRGEVYNIIITILYHICYVFIYAHNITILNMIQWGPHLSNTKIGNLGDGNTSKRPVRTLHPIRRPGWSRQWLVLLLILGPKFRFIMEMRGPLWAKICSQAADQNSHWFGEWICRFEDAPQQSHPPNLPFQDRWQYFGIQGKFPSSLGKAI